MKWMWVLLLLSCSLVVSAQGLRVGFGTHKPPYLFEGQGRGLEYDIVVAAARSAGYTTEIHYLPLERLHLLLRRGEIDAITGWPLSWLSACWSWKSFSLPNSGTRR